METSSQYRIGIDIGGTFTDVVLFGEDGLIATKKVLSTKDDYSKSIITGLLELFDEHNLSPETITGVVHGTTVATNAILEHKGAKTALITTAGFRDVLELRRIRIPELYNLFYKKPPPLVPRRYRFEVDERTGPDGEVRKPLNVASVQTVVDKIRAMDAEAIAVTFLHSYANPNHEQAVREIVEAELPDVYVSCSVDILPEIREYERTSTTVINAYVGPLVERYIRSLLDKLRSIGVAAPLRIMQSSGSVLTAESVMQKPAHIVESGPAAGVIGAAQLAKRAGHNNVITLDMGGTTAKASMIENAEVVQTTEYEVGGGINLSSQLVKGGGYALKLPVVDLSEIGAGGGSIAWIDDGGLLQIGPQSAGAMPGPVCYDAGGEKPTLTDAHIVLGYINPKRLAGGRIKLDRPKAEQVLAQTIAARLKKSVLESAYGIHVIASAKMMRAVKAVSTYRGRDPRECVLFAYGGSGPLCAVEMAKELNMKRILVPPAAGLFSAFGLLFSNLEYDFVETHFRRANEISVNELNDAYITLERRVKSLLEQDGYRNGQIQTERLADLRYSGQAYELTVKVARDFIDDAGVVEMIEAFEQEHLKTYGHRAAGDPVDLVNLRVKGRAVLDKPRDYDLSALYPVVDRRSPSERPSRQVYFGPEHGPLETPIFSNRWELPAEPTEGPLIVEEYDTTCLVPPGCAVGLDNLGNIVIDVEA